MAVITCHWVASLPVSSPRFIQHPKFWEDVNEREEKKETTCPVSETIRGGNDGIDQKRKDETGRDVILEEVRVEFLLQVNTGLCIDDEARYSDASAPSKARKDEEVLEESYKVAQADVGLWVGASLNQPNKGLKVAEGHEK